MSRSMRLSQPSKFKAFKDGGIVAPYERLPKSFRKFLERHGDEMLDTFELFRAPLDSLTTGILQLLTAGDWNGIKQRAGTDKLFHTYAVINGKYLYEKTAVPVLKEGTASAVSKEGAEKTRAPVSRMSIRDFVGNAINHMGDKYFSYNPFTNNCQDFLMASLDANNMNVPVTRLFLKQDVKKLVEETPSLSKYLAEKLVNVATTATNAYEEVTQKRGGIRRREIGSHCGHKRKLGA